jgi:Flp pilus assembly protein TadG
MTTKTAILTFVLLLLLAGGVVLGVYLVRQNQDVRSRADTAGLATPYPTVPSLDDQLTAQQQGSNAQTGGACTPPNEVSNVAVNYPDCN